MATFPFRRQKRAVRSHVQLTRLVDEAQTGDDWRLEKASQTRYFQNNRVSSSFRHSPFAPAQP